MKNENIEEEKFYILGIDLGTSNSYAAIITKDNDKPFIIPNEFWLLSTPSFVTFLKSDKRLVGQLSRDNINWIKYNFLLKEIIRKNIFRYIKRKIRVKLTF